MRESTSKVGVIFDDVLEVMLTWILQFNEERSVAALQNARNEILNLGKAIADVEERFGKYRVDKVGPEYLKCLRIYRTDKPLASNPRFSKYKSNTTVSSLV